jgi:hypothetical protein
MARTRKLTVDQAVKAIAEDGMSPMTKQEVQAALDGLVEEGFLTRSPDGRYSRNKLDPSYLSDAKVAGHA